MKIDENGVLHEVDENDVVDGVLTIPEGVRKIDRKIRGDLKSFRTLPNGRYEEIPSVTELTKKVELPSTLIQIEGTGFRNFEMLKNIAIPDSVTEIVNGTFKNCTNLKHISLSRNLERIPD